MYAFAFPADTPGSWLDTFKPFTLHHLVAVLVCLAIMLAVSLRGRALRATPAGNQLRRAVAITGILYWIGSNAWWCWPTNFDFARGLPIQVCDIAGLIGPLAILTQKRWLRAILCFWGFALSTQGFFTPVLKVGGAYTEYWLFWSNHTIIVGTAFYDVIALGFRPKWRDWGISIAALLVYAALVLPFDIHFGVNYGYMGDTTPDNPTIIDKLGKWPNRLLPFYGIVIVATALFCLPWTLIQRRDAATAPPPAPSAP